MMRNLLIRVTDEEKAQIKAKAEKLHLATSRYMILAAIFWNEVKVEK